MAVEECVGRHCYHIWLGIVDNFRWGAMDVSCLNIEMQRLVFNSPHQTELKNVYSCLYITPENVYKFSGNAMQCCIVISAFGNLILRWWQRQGVSISFKDKMKILNIHCHWRFTIFMIMLCYFILGKNHGHPLIILVRVMGMKERITGIYDIN